MKDLSKIELAILVWFEKIMASDDELELTDMNELTETNESLKIRELVYYLDLLSQKEYIEVEDDYYEEGGSITFRYVNNAVSVYKDKIKLTDKGVELLKEHKLSIGIFSRKSIIAGSIYLLIFLLGMLTMYMLIYFEII